MTRRYDELALTDDDRAVLLGNGVDVGPCELDPVEGATGHHVAIWIDDELELEFMITADAPVEEIVQTLERSLAQAAASVDAGSVVVVAVEVTIVEGELEFGAETARAAWFTPD